ncbi:gamma-glutamyltransferase family protein [Paenalcaligenes niemegkensis]|uniref:gamma-glutamyltransferase family protein n=1 Tax=Paenalcaligenes niemegkensis TaxID=2895469 RepID=UPI001EE8CBFE|nr:gamma-glutamyltransferase family protein [Paenalcaligenes niemegkensis]MCQ9617813.1 gamma-glutamyltransferase family protein [Paenalcaligenes niemegkensis]
MNQQNPYAVPREPVYAQGGMVATSHPLAAEAGLAILRAGGNAIDAALAAATTLTVVEPTQNGVGGDAFALVWDGQKLHALNGSGRSSKNTSYESLGLKHGDKIEALGWQGVTVPGAPRAWAELHRKFGKTEFSSLFKSAISYAREGYPLSPVVAEYWRRAQKTMKSHSGEPFKAWHDTFLPEGFIPKAGEVWRSEDLARTLEQLADSRSEAMYVGDLAEKICEFAAKTGGLIDRNDLAAYRPEWVEPISANYQGYTVWELPPNNQALATLLALNILDGLNLAKHREDEHSIHLQIEAMKLGFIDTLEYVGDNLDKTIINALLNKEYAAERRNLIGDQALEPRAGIPKRGNTVYLAVADKSGMMVSFIQSNYMGFGSGIVVPETGIALHNRGHSFNTIKGHANELGPNKRPYHTIMPGFLTKAGKAVGPFGVMGAYMQPQGHLQMVLNTIQHHMHPQAALDAPRWQWVSANTVRVEQSMPKHVVRSLLSRGHDVVVSPDDTGFGRGQIIWRLDNDVFVGGSDCRADGQVAAY